MSFHTHTNSCETTSRELCGCISALGHSLTVIHNSGQPMDKGLICLKVGGVGGERCFTWETVLSIRVELDGVDSRVQYASSVGAFLLLVLFMTESFSSSVLEGSVGTFTPTSSCTLYHLLPCVWEDCCLIESNLLVFTSSFCIHP